MTVTMVRRSFTAIITLVFAALALTGCGSSSTGASNNNNAKTATPHLMGGAIQGKTLTVVGSLATLAGFSSDIPTQFDAAAGIASDGTFLYVADGARIRRISIATGEVTALPGKAGTVGFNDVTADLDLQVSAFYGVAWDGKNLFATGGGAVWKIDVTTGAVTVLAGKVNSDVNVSKDGTGSDAAFAMPTGIATDGTNLYVTDSGTAIRKVVIATGEVSTLAGRVGVGGSTDGTGLDARFGSLRGIATDGRYLFVTDISTVRKVEIATGAVTTVAGNAAMPGWGDGIGEFAYFSRPADIATDGSNLFVTDGQAIRKVVIATGEVTTPNGPPYPLEGYVDGNWADARFADTKGITTDGTKLYITDPGNRTIRIIVIATGAVTTLARGTSSFGSTDGTGSSAHFYRPAGITTDGSNLYVADQYNRTIRKVVIATGEVSTIAGSAFSEEFASQDGTGASARFIRPSRITCDGRNLFVVDSSTIRKVVLATGEVATLAGTEAGLSSLSGLTTDGRYLYVSDPRAHAIRKLDIAGGAVTTLAGGSAGTKDGIGAGAQFNNPADLTTNGVELFVADATLGTIRKIQIATGVVTTLSNIPAFNHPQSLTMDGTNLFVADNAGVTEVELATGLATVISRDYMNYGITTDGQQLFVTEPWRNTVSVVQ